VRGDAASLDMSPEGIESRLLAASRLSPLTFIPLPRVDMAPESIEARLRECAEMSAVCRELEAEAAHEVDAQAPL